MHVYVHAYVCIIMHVDDIFCLYNYEYVCTDTSDSIYNSLDVAFMSCGYCGNDD
jgi:hypothetical protein